MELQEEQYFPDYKARRFGINSPIITDKYVIQMTTIAKPIVSLYGQAKGKRQNTRASNSAMVAPPKAPAKIPMNVMRFVCG